MENQYKVAVLSLGIVALALLIPIKSFSVGENPQNNNVQLRELSDNEKAILYLQDKSGKNFNKLINIASCESRLDIEAFNQKSNDYGFLQINARTWDRTAQEIGYRDYKTNYKSNIDLAIYIYDRYGDKPWKYSKHCWSKKSKL